ncbi:alpha-tocopherol transfer protein-like [Culex quinquefasciatus]|uniref:alpha-tocopherol transfer protein-like n=1 Tax=Culex quinquefasciatus TaxID=7176 RepID=UPI0018E395FE|nr:alpha-tocopherol transfer protein-like [Culex quinquefasciatus]
MASFTVEKCPQSYDEYKFTLDERHLEKARNDLNETDENRSQSLAQMREWIAKHPHIQKCRTDSIFLLRFLRMRKFSVPMAQESLERYLTALRSFPQWFRNLDPLDGEIRHLNKAGVLTNLGRDLLGRTVVLIRVRAFDTERFPSASLIRQIMLLLETTIDEEESQINGYVVVADYLAVSLKLLSVWSLTDVSNTAESLFQSFPMRIQEIHAIGVPRFLKILIDLTLSYMSEKIRNRVYCHKSLDDAKKHLELSLLTTDYEGGTQNPDQLTEDFIKCAERKRTQLLLMDEMEIDTSRYQFGGQQNTVVSEIEAGMVGSFKKLNVD